MYALNLLMKICFKCNSYLVKKDLRDLIRGFKKKHSFRNEVFELISYLSGWPIWKNWGIFSLVRNPIVCLNISSKWNNISKYLNFLQHSPSFSSHVLHIFQYSYSSLFSKIMLNFVSVKPFVMPLFIDQHYLLLGL